MCHGCVMNDHDGTEGIDVDFNLSNGGCMLTIRAAEKTESCLKQHFSHMVVTTTHLICCMVPICVQGYKVEFEEVQKSRQIEDGRLVHDGGVLRHENSMLAQS